MSDKSDGGPAYPVTHNNDTTGMSLRDYFAGRALELLMRMEEGRPPILFITDADRARRAYALADAMIEERKK